MRLKKIANYYAKFLSVCILTTASSILAKDLDKESEIYLNKIKAHNTVYIQIVNDKKIKLECTIYLYDGSYSFFVYPYSASLWYEEPDQYDWECIEARKPKR